MFSSKPNTPTLRFFGTRRSARLRDSRRRAFTLIELLMVIAVILILAGITFGISRGVQNAQARAKAKAELAVLSQALEQFKSRYGDYPWINISNLGNRQEINDASHGLLKTLVGWQSVDGTQVGAQNSDGVEFKKQRSALDVSRLSLSRNWPTTDPEASPVIETFFADPWGNAYVYIYKDSDLPESWDRFGYILFSRGPDGEAGGSGLDTNIGVFTNEIDFRRADENVDNIYAGE